MDADICDPRTWNLPISESPFLEPFLRESGLPHAVCERLREFAARGYLVLDLNLPEFDALAARIIADLAPRYPATLRRQEEAWYHSDAVRSLATCTPVLELLRSLYQREPIPFQTLNFDRGSEQPAHSDTVHFHCAPRHFMCGVWVALEDIDADNGPLVVYPGSHRLPDLDLFDLGLDPTPSAYGGYERRIRQLLPSAGFEPHEVHVRKGQAIVWAANLFHGGTAIRDASRTRHSQVTHYYFGDGLYYFPMGSVPAAGQICPREVIDIRSGAMVQHRFAGRDVRLTDFPRVWEYPRPLPTFVTAMPPRTPIDGDSDPQLAERVLAMERTVDHLREQYRVVASDNRRKDEFIRRRDEEWPYKICRRITKTWRALRGLPDEIERPATPTTTTPDPARPD